MSMPSVGIAGSSGARHWFPDLDLRGDPRLDLSIHSPAGSLDLDFIQKLDPALVRVSEPSEPASLVLHSIRRVDSLFTPSKEKGLFWADPVECLLDLYDLRFSEQAESMIASLTPGRKRL